MKTLISTFKLYAVFALFLTLAFSASAATEGRDYRQISSKPTVGNGEKIEVLEFFSYGCPHCATLAPVVANWEKKMPKDLTLVRVPVTWGRDSWVALARAYYTLDLLGAHEVSSKAFDAYQKENVKLDQEKEFLDWVAKNGVDRKKAADMYRSFAVDGKLNQGRTFEEEYRVQEVPHFFVNGMYEMNLPAFSSAESFFKGVEEVAAKIRVTKKK